MGARVIRASPGFLATLGVPIEQGRDIILPSDGFGAPEVAVVSRSFAEALWPEQDPIGRRLRFANQEGDFTPITVVGTAADAVESTDRSADQPAH